MGIEPSMSVNDLLRSLPKPRPRKIWNVIINGVPVQGVSATDNLQSTAEEYISNKYPDVEFQLVFMGWKY